MNPPGILIRCAVATFLVALLTPFEGALGQWSIPDELQTKLRAMPGINDAKVEVTFDPPYTQEMMSEVAKLELGFL